MHNSHAEIENQMGAYLDAAAKVLKDAGKPLHYREITLRAITRKLITPGGKTPADSMGSQISTDIKRKGAASGFVRTKAGMYGLNPNGFREGNDDATKVQDSSESKKTQFIGKGGEYLVAGRLILHGFNASLLGVDEGLDIVAIKDGSMYGVQVKTANKSAKGYVADISVGAYERTNRGNTFYVFVLLGEPERHVILPFHAMEGLIDSGHIKTIPKSNRYRAIFTKDGNKVLLGKKDIKLYVDNWDSIK